MRVKPPKENRAEGPYGEIYVESSSNIALILNLCVPKSQIRSSKFLVKRSKNSVCLCMQQENLD